MNPPPDAAAGLPALPGADDAPTTAPASRALFENLLEDDGPVRADGPGVAATLDRYRGGAGSWHRDVLGALHVPAGAIDTVLEALDAGDRGVPVVLSVDTSGLDGIRQARNMILEDDRVELRAVHLGLPEDMSPAAGARAVLDTLDFTAPARLDAGLRPGWDDALSVVAADGAEDVAVDLGGLGAAAPVAPGPGEVGRFLRLAVDRDLTVHCAAGPDHAVSGDGGLGLLNVVCALRAALDGAGADDLATVLAHRDPAPLAAAVRRMSDADAAVVRSFLGSVACAEPGSVVDDLVALGLLDPRDEG